MRKVLDPCQGIETLLASACPVGWTSGADEMLKYSALKCHTMNKPQNSNPFGREEELHRVFQALWARNPPKKSEKEVSIASSTRTANSLEKVSKKSRTDIFERLFRDLSQTFRRSGAIGLGDCFQTFLRFRAERLM